MRGAPQSGFAAAILEISSRTCASSGGRPERLRPERQAHRRRSHSRCHRTTVSGRTMTNADRQCCQVVDKEHPKHSLRGAQVRPLDPALQRPELVSERKILEHYVLMPAAGQAESRGTPTPSVRAQRDPPVNGRRNQGTEFWRTTIEYLRSAAA
jgi:hypothetical protein